MLSTAQGGSFQIKSNFLQKKSVQKCFQLSIGVIMLMPTQLAGSAYIRQARNHLLSLKNYQVFSTSTDKTVFKDNSFGHSR